MYTSQVYIQLTRHDNVRARQRSNQQIGRRSHLPLTEGDTANQQVARQRDEYDDRVERYDQHVPCGPQRKDGIVVDGRWRGMQGTTGAHHHAAHQAGTVLLSVAIVAHQRDGRIVQIVLVQSGSGLIQWMVMS